MGSWEQEKARLAEVGVHFDADHEGIEMEIVLDQGVHRHIRFARPGTSMHSFSLVTWPGHLAISGDVESYTFRRLHDMFEFFGGDRGRISPSYWAEKCIAGRDRITSYDQEYARQQVIEYFAEAVRGRGVPRGAGRALRLDLLEHEEFAYEEGAHRLLRDFQHGEQYVASCRAIGSGRRCGWRCETDVYAQAVLEAREHERVHPTVIPVIKQPAFEFHDTWEWDLTSFDHHFLYACHAIAWGIGKYRARQHMPPRLWAKHGRS